MHWVQLSGARAAGRCPAQPMHNGLEHLSVAKPGRALRPLWHLDADCHFLNHGSFGATPRHVLAAQDAWRVRMERQPVSFMASQLPGALRTAAERLATFVGTEGPRLGFVENTTDGINAILRSIHWKTGDEIVLADHAYPAVRNSVEFLAQHHGVKVRWAAIPFPLEHAADISETYCAAITARTRLAIVDHVFSALAVVTPLEPVVAHCKSLGVRVLVDGAHGPGQLPLALDALDADWYVGNCHKWLCAPKGSAFLCQGKGAAVGAAIHPTVISNFFGSGFPIEFDWQGTRDYSAWLAVPAALDFLEAFGVARYQAHLMQQARQAASALCERWQVQLPAPHHACAAMVTLPWPHLEAATPETAQRCHDGLLREHRIEVPVLVIAGRLWLRISAQIYNDMADYEALGRALA